MAEKKQESVRYEPTDMAKAKPVFILKKQVAIGADVLTGKGKLIKEADQNQYAELYEAGYTRYIKKIG